MENDYLCTQLAEARLSYRQVFTRKETFYGKAFKSIGKGVLDS